MKNKIQMTYIVGLFCLLLTVPKEVRSDEAIEERNSTYTSADMISYAERLVHELEITLTDRKDSVTVVISDKDFDSKKPTPTTKGYFSVTANENNLIVTLELMEEEEQANVLQKTKGISYGSCTRVVPLPAAIDTTTIQADDDPERVVITMQKKSEAASPDAPSEGVQSETSVDFPQEAPAQ